MSMARLLTTGIVVVFLPLTSSAQLHEAVAVPTQSQRAVSESTFSLAASIGPESPSAFSRRRLLRVGKWTLLGVALGMGGYALVRSGDAEEQYEALRRLCDADRDRCLVEGGRYVDGEAETLYQTALLHDKRARIGIVAGQVSLLGSVALFIADLENDRGPSDIPYPSTRSHRVTGIGIRLTR